MKKTLRIQGMHCGGCATGLDILLNTKGVKAKVDFNSKEAEIEFEPKKTSLKAIKKEIENVGYKVN